MNTGTAIVLSAALIGAAGLAIYFVHSHGASAPASQPAPAPVSSSSVPAWLATLGTIVSTGSQVYANIFGSN
jgi:hypothetical protein